MAKIIFNERVSGDFYLMETEAAGDALPGQFYMLRAWENYPLLSRPVSVFDACADRVSFLYKVVGEGTRIFSGLRRGDSIELLGPLGNTLPDMSGKIALVGGGVGIAPLYLACKTIKRNSPDSTVEVFLGFSGEALLEDRYRQEADKLIVNIGGFITDELDPAGYDCIFACGPDAMMRAMYDKCERAGVAERLYVSLETHMACGIGACLVCSCETAQGNKKTCKDGPVFSGKAVYGI